MKTVHTIWEVWTYDVWGNARDGYEVNDRHCHERAFALDLEVKVNNLGTPQEFESASISDAQIEELWGLGVETDGCGDDLSYYFQRVRDGYPVGEMFCTSHESLSPIRVKG
jgi:hypothetical protein